MPSERTYHQCRMTRSAFFGRVRPCFTRYGGQFYQGGQADGGGKESQRVSPTCYIDNRLHRTRIYFHSTTRTMKTP